MQRLISQPFFSAARGLRPIGPISQNDVEKEEKWLLYMNANRQSSVVSRLVCYTKAGGGVRYSVQ